MYRALPMPMIGEGFIVIVSDGSYNVQSSMFESSKPKLGVRVRLLKDEHVQCPFHVQSTFNEH